ncbi:MAG: hypothetical protein K6A69_00365 [Lachnospiraceae bacterium]|nr:hypothetical protein [Lachnospiraceae bacterium]
MPKFTIILLIVTVVIVGITIALYFLGKRAEKKKAEQDEQIQAAAQSVSMLIIDKKRMKLKDAGLPEQVVAQTPWYAKGSKLPIVKAKVGPKIMTLICDATIFDEIPVKKEVKAMVSGLYITSVRGLHGKIEKPEEKKKGLRAWATRKMKEYNQSKA